MSTSRSAVRDRSGTGEHAGRGQIAIGTLIIFIAMLLVATITAGVLLNVAGILESETERTGEETTSQLSERLDVVAVTGEDIEARADGTREIQRITVVVTNPSSSEDIDVTRLTAQWIGPNGAYSLRSNASTADPGQPTFSTTVFSDPDGTFPRLTSSEDKYGLVFEPAAFATEGLAEGESAELTIWTSRGAATELRLTVPPSLAGRDSVEL